MSNKNRICSAEMELRSKHLATATANGNRFLASHEHDDDEGIRPAKHHQATLCLCAPCVHIRPRKERKKNSNMAIEKKRTKAKPATDLAYIWLSRSGCLSLPVCLYIRHLRVIIIINVCRWTRYVHV